MHLKIIPQRFIFMGVGEKESGHLDSLILGEFGDEELIATPDVVPRLQRANDEIAACFHFRHAIHYEAG